MLSRIGRREFIRSCGAFGCVLIGNPIALFQSVHASRDPVAIWRFDQLAGARTPESARGLLDAVSNRGNSPEWACGASGSALRFDGYSTWLSHPASLAPRPTHQSVEEESAAQMLRNTGGEAHDAFMCSKSTDDSAIVSFDYGHYWWGDDGRCAAQIAEQQEATLRAQQMQEQAREQAAQRKQEEEQTKRDQDAEFDSYWPTTIRVDTDMDTFWLPDEERMCQTYPDGNGRVAVVACNASGSHRDHNIPVKFWGGVDRNKISDWKCRREGDQFVCRATD